MAVFNPRAVFMQAILFKKIRDTKGTFHAKMGSIKDGNGMDLTEAVQFSHVQFFAAP